MCGLCGSFARGHWSDGVPDGARAPIADRIARAKAASALLAPYGLALREWGGRFVLSSRTGRTEIVEGFGDLWPTAERLCGRPCDPLDEEAVARLEQAG